MGRTKSDRITTFITAIIENSSDNIRLGQEMQDAYNKLNRFLFDAVYTNPSAKGEEVKAQTLLRYLYRYFASSPEKMPEEYQKIAQQEDLDRAVCDYISGMTDRYAVAVYEELMIPRAWGI